MGFKLSKALTTIPITIAFHVHDEVTGEIERTEVTHVLKTPSLDAREKFERNATIIKGKKIEVNRRRASLKLWEQCVVDVKNYDDIEIQFPRDNNGALTGDWKGFFLTNDVLQLHCVEFVERLLEHSSGEEADFEKKSDSSAEQ